MPTNRIPIAVLKRAAEALLPGPDVTRAEQRHGKKTKLTVLRELMKADPAFKKRVRQFYVQDRSADSKAYARERGWIEGAAQDDGRLAFWTAYYEEAEAKELAEKGSSNYTRCFADECGCMLADMLHGRRTFEFRDEAELVASLKDIVEGRR